jgi:hypothetical protein
VYTWGDFFGDVGGMSKAVSFLGQVTVGILAARLFYAALIRDTFRVRLDAGGADMSKLIESKFRNSDHRKSVVGKPWKLAVLDKP